MLLQLLVECANLFLRLLGLCSLQLVDIANESVLLRLFGALVGHSFLDDHFQVAVKKVKPRYVIPRLKDSSGEDYNLVFAEQLLEFLCFLGCGSLMPLLFPA